MLRVYHNRWQVSLPSAQRFCEHPWWNGVVHYGKYLEGVYGNDNRIGNMKWLVDWCVVDAMAGSRERRAVFLSGPAWVRSRLASLPAAKNKPTDPVWRENPFLTTTATQFSRGLHQESACTPAAWPPRKCCHCGWPAWACTVTGGLRCRWYW
jgi:hypothetical protein